jgi:hypothetical protein
MVGIKEEASGTTSESQVEVAQSFPEDVIRYDDKGLSGILRSPYVFGAAALASLGGFSFGYGKTSFLPSPLLHPVDRHDVADKADLRASSAIVRCRPGCYLHHPRHEAVP